MLGLLAYVLTLGACGGNKKTRDLAGTLDELYQRGTKSMNSGNYRNAIQYFETLTARFPFANQAKQAQLDLLYCYYRNGDKDLAIDSALQFERENPTHPRVDYALYMRGLAQFSGEHNRFHRLFRLDLAKRPPVDARESFSAFSQLVKRYPDSVYAADARQRMIFLRNRLADHEIYVARYYMRRGAYAAALNRAQYVMNTFDGAPAVADALDVMVEAYENLGMRDLAADTRSVLRENYPDRPSAKPPKKEKAFIFF
ncbi:MAG: outer membrane protein assembly factor BamD [Gammaproteobacteria bacterium]|nr:outer membrane protein assembly factor BamD [Gammaproteobacteria bacterium]